MNKCYNTNFKKYQHFDITLETFSANTYTLYFYTKFENIA